MQKSPFISTIPLVITRNFITPIVLLADKSLFSLSQKSKLLQILRWFTVSLFLLFLHFLQFLPDFIPNFLSLEKKLHKFDDYYDENKPLIKPSHVDCAIARALYQLLSLVNEIPVSSRKYDVVRCLAEKLIDENLKEGLEEINCEVLSGAFAKTLGQLEAAMLDQAGVVGLESLGSGCYGLGRAMRAVQGWWRVGGAGLLSAEKMAAELLWLAQKMEASGGVEVAIGRWASASNLGWLALSAEPRIQASLVKITAFFIKQAKDNMGKEQQTEGGEKEHQKQIKMNLLMTWLPLLCRASNGTDTPTLSTSERGEIERALEEIIDKLEEEENREKILCLWVHHFSLSPSSDWPNLYGSYLRWYTDSRKLLLTPCKLRLTH